MQIRLKNMEPDIMKSLDEYTPVPGELGLWWLGQSGFAVKLNKTVLYLDPYLSTRLERRTENKPLSRHIRMMPSPLDPYEVSNAGYIICSHNHGDHLDPETVIPMLQSSPAAKLIVPPVAKASLTELGIHEEKIIPVGAGDQVRLDGFDVTAIPGKHNEFDYYPVTGYPYVGYILNLNGIKIYHAGDTIFYEDLLRNLSRFSIDIALLPINGGDRDRVGRGFMSNLQFWEAADLAAQLKVKLVIPTHYDMFTINTENVERFEYYMDRKYPDIRYIVPQIGEPIVFSEN